MLLLNKAETAAKRRHLSGNFFRPWAKLANQGAAVPSRGRFERNRLVGTPLQSADALPDELVQKLRDG
jgi:hypothetical protein